MSMTIFNFISNIIIIVCLMAYITKKNFYVSANKTFWMKKVCSFSLMKRNSKNSAYGIFHIHIPFRDYKKMNDWDSEQFRNGNYTKKENSKKVQNNG